MKILFNIIKKLICHNKDYTDSKMIRLPNNARIFLGNAQHIGKRNYQEDSYGFSNINESTVWQYGLLAVVADGMGGLSNGKQVSEEVVRSYIDWFNTGIKDCNGEMLVETALRTNYSICEKYCPNGKVLSGSTLSGVFVKNNQLYWIGIGDSKIILKRGKKLIQISEDHNLYNQILNDVLDDKMSVQDALLHKKKEALTSFLGKKDIEYIDYNHNAFNLEHKDKIVICSDGVYNFINKNDLFYMLNNDPQSAADNIINHIYNKKIHTQDNMTIIIISYEENFFEGEK